MKICIIFYFIIVKPIVTFLFALPYRIAQGDYKDHLKGIKEHSDLVTGTLEEMASDQQRKFEALVANDKCIYEKACKGMFKRICINK